MNDERAMPTRRVHRAWPLATFVALLATACGATARQQRTDTPSAAAPSYSVRPAGCTAVPAGAALGPVVEHAPDGATLCLAPGRYAGPLRIAHLLHLWGPRDAVLESNGEGTTLEVAARGATVVGLTIDGSGGRYDLDDAAVKVHADDVRIEGVRIVDAIFGILVERVSRVQLRHNEIHGRPGLPRGLRGDAIRLWETRDSVVADNTARDGRDVVLWYSSHNRFLRNTVTGSRYGTHLMYSHDNEIRGNVYREDTVGVFVMYSHRVRLLDNQLLGMSTAAGMGMGLKECGGIEVRGNRFVRCTTGLYIDTSPLSVDETDVATGNELVFCDTAILFHGRADRNLFRDNVLRQNGEQLAVDGGDDARAALWDGNYYDDYAGYDLDGDGVGDVPHEERSLRNEMVARRDSLAFFNGTPALGVVEALGRLVPLFAPHALLDDARPRMNPPEPSHAD